MLSIICELAGLAALAAAAFIIAGLGPLLVVGGVELLILGVAADGALQRPGKRRKGK